MEKRSPWSRRFRLVCAVPLLGLVAACGSGDGVGPGPGSTSDAGDAQAEDSSFTDATSGSPGDGGAGEDDAATGDGTADDAGTEDAAGSDGGSGDSSVGSANDGGTDASDASEGDSAPRDASAADAEAGDGSAPDAGKSTTDSGETANDANAGDANDSDANESGSDAGETTGDASNGDSGAVDAAGADASGASCATAGFAASPLTWTLPTSAYGFPWTDETLGTSTCDATGELQWATFDINGDALPDLVVTDQCFTSTIGETQWSVYLGTGSAFATTATTWSLPSSTYGFPTTSFSLGTDTCDATGELQWSTFDINGDALPDLVVTDQCFTTTIGETQWAVYLNTGGGFSSTATTWSLPSSTYGFPTTSYSLGTSTCDATGELQWSTFDINGDALPDLVVTDQCFTTTIGETRWAVYLNTGSGFSSTATTWSLPSSTYGFPTTSYSLGTSTCDATGELQWSTFDINGDAFPDLVVTDVCFGTGVGQTQWSVYLNTGSGFSSTATTWSLPSSTYGFPTASYALGTSTCDATGELEWSTLDIDADGYADLVVTDECFGTTVGVTQWDVYLGSATGFASTPSCFPLPPGYTGFPRTSETFPTSECGAPAEIQWSVLDMNGDKKPDLAVTDQCFDANIGTTRWNVHLNQR